MQERGGYRNRNENKTEFRQILNDKGINCKLIDMHTIKPLDCSCIHELLKTSKLIVTVEEHSIHGGLGGAVAEALMENEPVPMKRIGVYDTFGESGPAVELLKKYRLDAQGIYEQVKEFLNK